MTLSASDILTKYWLYWGNFFVCPCSEQVLPNTSDLKSERLRVPVQNSPIVMTPKILSTSMLSFLLREIGSIKWIKKI